MDLSAVIHELRREMEEIDQAIRSLEALEHLHSKAVGRPSKERKAASQNLKRTTGAAR